MAYVFVNRKQSPLHRRQKYAWLRSIGLSVEEAYRYRDWYWSKLARHFEVPESVYVKGE